MKLEFINLHTIQVENVSTSPEKHPSSMLKVSTRVFGQVAIFGRDRILQAIRSQVDGFF